MKRSVSMIFVGVATLAFVVLGVSACGSSTGAEGAADDSKALEGRSWKATTISGVDSVLGAKEFTAGAGFAAGEMSGSGTINRYNASYVTGPGNTIEITPGMTTMMAGPEYAMAQENAYFAAIEKAATYKVTDDSLTLLDDQGQILVEYVLVPATHLTGTEWQAIAYNNGKGGLESLAADSTITAVFQEDGTLGGSAGVNKYSIAYTVSDPDQMTIDQQIAVTAMAGPDDLMAQEAAYLAALPLTATYEIDGDTLWLRDANGAALAQFVAK